MKTLKIWAGVVVLSSAAVLPTWAADVGDVAEDKLQTYRMAAKEFGESLKAELQKGMKEGGPVAAIGICNTKAMLIADEYSKKAGFMVGRTSLKARNSKNVPDEWEKAVLMQFEESKTKGTDPQTLEYAKIVEAQDGSREIRYMKAIPTAQICVACHGAVEEMDKAVVERLDNLYPQDQARGFKVGDLRGAFSIREKLKTAE